MTDEGVAALGARDPATGAHRMGRLRQLSLSGCVKLSGRGLGWLPPGLQALRLGFCSNLKVPCWSPGLSALLGGFRSNLKAPCWCVGLEALRLRFAATSRCPADLLSGAVCVQQALSRAWGMGIWRGPGCGVARAAYAAMGRAAEL